MKRGLGFVNGDRGVGEGVGRITDPLPPPAPPPSSAHCQWDISSVLGGGAEKLGGEWEGESEGGRN